MLNRFERDVDGGTAFASYCAAAGVARIFYTEVPAALRGEGAGSAFVRDVLEKLDGWGSRSSHNALSCERSWQGIRKWAKHNLSRTICRVWSQEDFWVMLR